MFTGIIEAVGKVKTVSFKKEGLWCEFLVPKSMQTKIGASINVNGVCSTVQKYNKGSILISYMPETLDKTYFAKLKTGDLVNLERSIKATDRLEGHIVQGHADTVGTITAIQKRGESFEVNFKAPVNLKLVADKGSIAVDGISLTVVKAGKSSFSVSFLLYTWQHTNFKTKKVGDKVNLEFDVLAKYLQKLIE